MATMKDIIQSPLLLALVIGGLLYISAFSLVYLKKAYDHCLELGNVIKSSLIFSVVPSLSIVVGLFVLIAVLGSVWAWWRLSVIGSLSYETMISSSIAQVLGYASSAEMLESATGRQFGVVMILMSVAILTLAAVCASFISPVFELPAVKTASGYLLPALFGSMALGLFASSSSGSKVVKGGIKGVLPVLIIMTVLSLAARLAGYGSVLGGLVGIFIIVMLPIGILTSYVLWKKGKIQVVDKVQKEK